MHEVYRWSLQGSLYDSRITLASERLGLADYDYDFHMVFAMKAYMREVEKKTPSYRELSAITPI